MSFILDALKKLEHKRQQDSVPHLSTIHTHDLHKPAKRPFWPYLLLAALVLNAGILLAWIAPWNAKSDEMAVVSSVNHNQEQENAQELQEAPEVIEPETVSANNTIKDKTVIDNIQNDITLKPEPAAPTPSETVEESISAQMENREIHSSTQLQDNDQTASLELTPSVQELESLRDQIKLELEVAGTNNEITETAPGINNKSDDIAKRDIMELSELPSEIRKDIPDISIFGHIYSGEPSSRLVNINGSIIREGETVTRNLKVTEITTTGVVFDYQGLHFKVRAF